VDPATLRCTNRNDIVMLENLDLIPWKKVRYTYGSAAKVPVLLRGLASADESVRREALHHLHGEICDQGSRWEATALAVPFLFELVLDPATRDREDLVLFLVLLAFGDESEFLPFGMTPGEEPRPWTAAERAAYDAVAERITSLVPLVRETEPLRLAAAYALAWFPRSTAGAAGDVRRAYDASTDETTRATLLIALAMLSLHVSDKDEVVTLLRHVHGGEGSAILRSSAAAGLVLLGAKDDDVVQTIVAALIEGAAGNTKMPWNDGDFDGYLALLLPFAARGREAAVAAMLIDALADARTVAPVLAKLEITRALLAVVVPSAGYRALSDLQRRALKAILEHGRWVRNGPAVVNFGMMGNGYGLPSDLDDFRSFVEAAEASARGETVDWKPRERPRADERPDWHVPAYFVVLFGVPLLLWIVLAALDHNLLPSTPRGWGLLSFFVLGVGVSWFFLRRLSPPRRTR
jgi:hypothetical protein